MSNHIESGPGLHGGVKKLKQRLTPLQTYLKTSHRSIGKGKGGGTTDSPTYTDTRSTGSSWLDPNTPTAYNIPVLAEYNLKSSPSDPDLECTGESIEVMAHTGDVMAGVTLISSPANRLQDTEQEGKETNGNQLSPKSVADSSTRRQKKKKANNNNTFFSRLKKQQEQHFKTCFFTGQTISGTQAYYHAQIQSECLVVPLQVYTLASSMKLIGCPTICDDDLRRMDRIYFTQNYRRLPEELRLSSNWTRVAKFCSFSGQPIPDGVPFYYARRRGDGSTNLGRYCYLRADVVWGEEEEEEHNEEFDLVVTSSIGGNIVDRPLTNDNLITLLAEYPDKCDTMPSNLVQEPSEWTLISKFCFFSGGPVKADDTYYKTRFNGRDIYLLVVLSPQVTARELFRLDKNKSTLRKEKNDSKSVKELQSELIPMTVKEVERVEKVYALSSDDFESLRRKHLGKYMELPTELTNPKAWKRVVPPGFLEAKEEALQKAREYEKSDGHSPSPSTEHQQEIVQSATDGLQLLNIMIGRAKRGVMTMQCGTPESFSLKELMQDDASFIRELVENESIFDDDENSLAEVESLKRYASMAGAAQDMFYGDNRFSVGSFDLIDEIATVSSVGMEDASDLVSGRGY